MNEQLQKAAKRLETARKWCVQYQTVMNHHFIEGDQESYNVAREYLRKWESESYAAEQAIVEAVMAIYYPTEPTLAASAD